MEDKELLQNLRNGSLQALKQIIDRYYIYVSAVIRNQLGYGFPESDVEELASDVSFLLWEKRLSIRSSMLRGWLGTVARNQTKSFLRKSRRRLSDVSLDDVIVIDMEDSAGLLEKREQARILEIALRELGEPDSKILTLYYYADCSVTSIAEQLQMHPEAVKSKIRRGREKLKQILLTEGYGT